MSLRSSMFVLPACVAWLITPSFLIGATIVVEAGQTHALAEDLMLAGSDVLEIRGTPDKLCILDGNRHRIRSLATWTGELKISHCTIRSLGSLPKRTAEGLVSGPGDSAFDLAIAGQGSIAIEHCTFDACAAIRIQTDGSSTARFRNNTVLENSVVAISKDIASSGDFFMAVGNSKERKLFQGNIIPRGKVVFRAPHWLVGGNRDAESNLFVGYRIGVVADGEGTVVRGNYFHLLMPITKEFPYWSQISVFTTGKAVVGEHNVIRDGEWIVRFAEGEFRYNVITDIVDHDLMQNGSNGRVHHNLFLAGASEHRHGSMFACIAVIYPPKTPGEGIEIFNNVFDGGGRLDVPAIEVSPKAFVKSIRNNVFYNFAHGESYYKRPQGMVRTSWNDEATEENPARLGYADYNLFYSPPVKSKRNYLLSVANKTEGTDAGFGLHDVPPASDRDGHVEPQFKGPIPKTFPFSDHEILSRKMGLSKILAVYREAYAPAAGSPLIGAGDPADGAGKNIGAVGGSPSAADDLFGRFGE